MGAPGALAAALVVDVAHDRPHKEAGREEHQAPGDQVKRPDVSAEGLHREADHRYE